MILRAPHLHCHISEMLNDLARDYLNADMRTSGAECGKTEPDQGPRLLASDVSDTTTREAVFEPGQATTGHPVGGC